MWGNGQELTQPCIEHKQDVQFPVYDGDVMKEFTNGKEWSEDRAVRMGNSFTSMRIKNNCWTI